MKLLSFSDPVIPEPPSERALEEPDRVSLFLKDLTDTLKRAFIKTASAVNFNIAESGPTTARPTTDPNLKAGQPFFDTTINKPVWWKASTSQWVDATGTPS